MKNIKVIGITGQSGSGKSTACEVIREMGYPVIDADQVAKDIVMNGQQCLAELALEFSICILNVDGTLNRPRLASIVFNDPEQLTRMNEIMFPYINEEIEQRLKKLDSEKLHKLVILDAPTLFESGCSKICDAIISVLAPENVRLSRIIIRDRITDQQARERISAQNDDSYYISRSNFVIKNEQSKEQLCERIKHMFHSISSIV